MSADRTAPPLSRATAPGQPHSAASTTRRSFLATAGLATAAAATRPATLACASPLLFKPTQEGASPSLPPISLLCSLADNTVALLRTDSPYPVARLSIPAPRAHAAHPTLPITYLVNATSEHDHRPRGSVSAIHRDLRTNTLTPLATEPLALHSTHPERLAVSPSGEHLLALSAHSGSLTLLPLAPDGSLQPVTHTVRLPGRGPLSTQPRSAPFAAVFHPSAPLLYVTDRGTDSLLVFHCTSDALTLLHRHALPPAFAPTELTLTTPTTLVLASSTAATLLALPLNAQALPSGSVTLHNLRGSTTGPILLDPRTGHLLAITHAPGNSTFLSELHPALTTLRTTHLPGLVSVAQVALHDRTLLLAGNPHLLALDLGRGPAHQPRVLLRDHATLGLQLL